MSEAGTILAASVTRLFEANADENVVRASRTGAFAARAWAAIEAQGLPLALLSEDEGGFGFSIPEALDLIRIGGYFGSPWPIGETMVANLLLARAGLTVAEGPAVIVDLLPGYVEAHGVPWARHARTFVVVRDGNVTRMDSADATCFSGFSASGIPRDSVQFNGPFGNTKLPASLTLDPARTLGALVRSLEMAGALQRVLELTVNYGGERIQFGRPLSKFQIIQQQIAILATQTAAARAGADFASRAFDTGGMRLAIAAAKSRAGEAASIASGIAHQVHGAIGFTQEHRLHLFTRALWAWRDEHGNDAWWQDQIGAAVFANEADNFWSFVTAPWPGKQEA